ncbi:MAG: hypothetical protein QGH59_04180, partial [Gemmatimonadota bacterium]|nr:hypothetical protein [Gemmatimonadota bacterium]
MPRSVAARTLQPRGRSADDRAVVMARPAMAPLDPVPLNALESRAFFMAARAICRHESSDARDHTGRWAI